MGLLLIGAAFFITSYVLCSLVGLAAIKLGFLPGMTTKDFYDLYKV